MKIRLKAPAKGLTSTGIYGSDGTELPIGHEMDVENEPTGWAGRYDIVDGGSTEGKEPVTNPQQQTHSGYAVKEKGGGWFVITKGGDEVTKGLREKDLDGFNELSEEDKAAFADLHKKED